MSAAPPSPAMNPLSEAAQERMRHRPRTRKAAAVSGAVARSSLRRRSSHQVWLLLRHEVPVAVGPKELERIEQKMRELRKKKPPFGEL